MFGLTQKGVTMERKKSRFHNPQSASITFNSTNSTLKWKSTERTVSEWYICGYDKREWRQLPILNRAVSPLHLNLLWCTLLQTHPIPLSRPGKNQGGQSPWSTVIRARKVTSGYSFATPRAFLVTVILQYTVQNHYSCIQFALTRILCSEKHLFLFL